MFRPAIRYSYRDYIQQSPIDPRYNYDYAEYRQESPFLQNLMNPITPKRHYLRMEQSPSLFIQQSIQPESNYHNTRRSSNRIQKNSSKLTKASHAVTAFDEELQCQEMQEQQEYSFKQNRTSRMTVAKTNAFTSLNQLFEQNQSIKKASKQQDVEEVLLHTKLTNIQQQIMQLNTSIIDIENHFTQLRINQLEFLKQKEPEQVEPQTTSQQTRIGTKKEIKNNDNDPEPTFRMFIPDKTPKDFQLILTKPEDNDKYSLQFMQSTLTNIIGKLSQVLQNSSIIKPTFKNYNQEDDDEDQVEPSVFTFNKTLNKFTRVYKCKFCDQKFNKACSLGGHISRVHKLESQKSKNNSALPIKKTSIQKQRKQALLRNINKCLRGE